eukprot:SAG11_NODE_1639_length_4533_cov_5.684484_3_plen_412_part_00
MAAKKRLRRLGEVFWNVERSDSAAVALPLVRLGDDGSVLPEDLDMLQRLEAEAATSKEYRRAGALRSTFEALRPKSRMTLESCAPTDVDEQHAFFLEHGFILLRDLLPAETLARAQAAWTRAQERAEAAWQVKKGGDVGGLSPSQRLYFDLPNLLAEDDSFIDMIDSPALVPLMSRITGVPDALDPARSIKEFGYSGCMRVDGMGGRVVPSDAGTDGYTRWHNDQPLPDDSDLPNYRSVKVFVGMFDLAPNGGATAVVPGTHRIPGGPSTSLRGRGEDAGSSGLGSSRKSPSRKHRGTFKSSGDGDGDEGCGDARLPQSSMPNYVEAALPAGCGIAFDSHVWHTSMPNTSGVDRRCAYFVYRSSGRLWPQLPEWGPVGGLSEATLRRLDSEGKLGVQRRRILGLPDTGTGQ